MSESILKSGLRTIEIEERSIANLKNYIDQSFVKAVEIIINCKGRTVITGVGKSGIIAQKMVATLNSTGTPSLYLHPTDAVHGDLGMVRPGDVVIAISKSGNSEEMVYLLPLFKRLAVPVISMVGNLKSKMVPLSDVVLNCYVEEEACPLDLAPTSSTTATLVMGDALAVALLEARNFTKEDFAFFHPGGSLGKRLLLTSREFMVSGDSLPKVYPDSTMKETLFEITKKRMGATLVVDSNGFLAGVVTDGDVRRGVEKYQSIFEKLAKDVMSPNPKTIPVDSLATAALQKMEAHNITQIVAVDSENKPVGLIHIHDLIKAGLES